jgi:very-short-patch-repair endonuclease
VDRAESGERQLERLAARQYGLITRRQAREYISEDMIARRLASHAWEIVHRAVYRLAAVPVTWRQRVLAATLWAGRGTLASHRCAAVLWGLDGVVRGPIEITVDRSLQSREADLLVHRSAVRIPADQAVRYGIPVTSATRTIIDLAGVVDGDILELALEDALRRHLTSVATLRWRLEGMAGPGRRGARRLRPLLEERRGRPLESALEVRFEQLLRRHGLPLPERQRVVGSRRVDFLYPIFGLVVEVMGWRYHGGRRSWADDVRRRRELSGRGLTVVEYTYDDLVHRGDEVVADLRERLTSYSVPSSGESS